MFFSKPQPSADDAFFVWSDREHSVGVQAFDAEHQQLAAWINRAHAVLVDRRDRSQAVPLMERLIAETRAHFLSEERALEAAGFPDLEAHALEHVGLIQEAENLLRHYKAGNVSALALPTFLKDWLVSHIQGSDRKYAACLRRARANLV